MKVAMIAVFTAVSLGTNYAMIDVPNVKLMDALVFTAAFLFGLDVGVGSAVSIWAIYGFVNPYGQADFITLFFVMVGECFYALAGGLLRRVSVVQDSLRQRNTTPRRIWTYLTLTATLVAGAILSFILNILVLTVVFGSLAVMSLFLLAPIYRAFGLIGFLSTFAYDVLTNFGTWIFRANSVYQAFIIGMITGAPFAAVHEASNLFFFATVAPVAILASQRMGFGIRERRFVENAGP